MDDARVVLDSKEGEGGEAWSRVSTKWIIRRIKRELNRKNDRIEPTDLVRSTGRTSGNGCRLDVGRVYRIAETQRKLKNCHENSTKSQIDRRSLRLVKLYKCKQVRSADESQQDRNLADVVEEQSETRERVLERSRSNGNDKQVNSENYRREHNEISSSKLCVRVLDLILNGVSFVKLKFSKQNASLDQRKALRRCARKRTGTGSGHQIAIVRQDTRRRFGDLEIEQQCRTHINHEHKRGCRSKLKRRRGAIERDSESSAIA